MKRRGGKKGKNELSKKTGQCKVKWELAISYGVGRGSTTRSIHSKYKRATEQAPDQDMQVSGGQFQGKLQSAIQESPDLVGKPESRRSKLQFDGEKRQPQRKGRSDSHGRSNEYKNLLLERQAIQSAAEINSSLLFLLFRLHSPFRRGGQLESCFLTSIFLNKPRHLARQRQKTASPNEVPMYSSPLQREQRRYAGKAKTKTKKKMFFLKGRRKTATTERICKKKSRDPKNECA